MSLVIIFISIFLPLLFLYHIISFCYLLFFNKEIFFIEKVKIKSKKTILIHSIRLPEGVFTYFERFIKKFYLFFWITIGVVIFFTVSFVLFLICFYIFVSKRFDSQSLFSIILSFIFLLDIPLISTTSKKKIKIIDKEVQEWKNENLLLSGNNLKIEKPENFENFKYLILNEYLEIKISIFKNAQKYFYSKKIKNLRNQLWINGELDKNKLIYFLLFNYDEIIINNVRYKKEIYLYFLKEILNNEFK